jgi:methylenetetrahydrofolate reductase (NADPH)
MQERRRHGALFLPKPRKPFQSPRFHGSCRREKLWHTRAPPSMKLIRDLLDTCRAARRPAISFEFYPPKSEEGVRQLFERTVPALLELRPEFCSVTYGAGGSTREKTLEIVDRLQREHGMPAMMHLTCVNATREELRAVVEEARGRGICNLLALRGDPPGGEVQWTKTAGGFEYSRELVAFLRELGGFSIGTAGFPEGHIAQRAGKYVDWQFLREKIEAGADFVITQLFFDNEDFYAFHEHLTRKLGVNVPIIPGILPVLSRGQAKKFVALCGAALPEPFLRRLDELGDDDAAVTEFGIEYASRQCEELLRFGAPGIHFYTLNKAHSSARVMANLGLA